MKAGAGPIGARLFQADFWTSARITRVHSDPRHGSSRHCSAVEFGPLPSPSGNGNHLINQNSNVTPLLSSPQVCSAHFISGRPAIMRQELFPEHTDHFAAELSRIFQAAKYVVKYIFRNCPLINQDTHETSSSTSYRSIDLVLLH